MPSRRSSDVENYDAIVIGAGPAGCAAAITIARSGQRVMLVESGRFPRWKVCGCCLGTHGQRVLSDLVDASTLDRARAPVLRSTSLWWRSRRVRLPSAGIRVISRGTLDTALTDAASASGVEIRFRCRARIIDAGRENGPFAIVRVTDLEATNEPMLLRARVIVQATGLAPTSVDQGTTKVRRNSLMGLGATSSEPPDWLEPGTLAMVAAPMGYVGSVLDEQGRVTWGAALKPSAIRAAGSPAAVVRALLDASGLSSEQMPNTGWRGTPLLTRRNRASSGRTYRVGDALGYVEPVTGEGMSWALLTGAALGEFVARAQPGAAGTPNKLGPHWRAQSSRMMRIRRARCAMIASVVRSPTLMRALTRVPSRVWATHPGVVARAIGSPAPRSEPQSVMS